VSQWPLACAARAFTAWQQPRFGVWLRGIADGERRHGRPQGVVRGEGSVIPMPVLARWRDEIGEPVEELERREVHDAVLARPG